MLIEFLSVLITASSAAQQPSRSVSRADRAANQSLSLMAAGREAELRSVAMNGKTFESRLFASYLLYKKNPAENQQLFVRAIPRGREQYLRYVEIPSTLTLTPGSETYEVRNPKVRWPISFWEIQKAIVEFATNGEARAIVSVLDLGSYGDGEIGEGLASDVVELFSRPKLVAKHWVIFKPHIKNIGACKYQMNEQEYQTLRDQYQIAFKNNREVLRVILDLLDAEDKK